MTVSHHEHEHDEALKQRHGVLKPKASFKNGQEKRDINATGVPLKVYANWLDGQLTTEEACLELPFTIMLLISFMTLALGHLGQETVTIVEDAIAIDIVENANFAWAHNFGHKNVNDVNSFPDFYSWVRLGLIPIVSPGHWYYSEGLADAVPQVPGKPAYDVNLLPLRRQEPGAPSGSQLVPVRNDYLWYNRIIGGVRFRKQVAKSDKKMCVWPQQQDSRIFEQWFRKPCSEMSSEELPPDYYATEFYATANDDQEWFFTDIENYTHLVQHVLDMEDGCASADAQNRTCLCTLCWSAGVRHPWLTELTQRVEISFIVYNAHYGMFSNAIINFWFNRAGHIHKLVNVRSAWVGVMVRPVGTIVMILASDIIWVLGCVYLVKTEGREIVQLIRKKAKPWYSTLIDDYISFWNCIDWTSILIAVVIVSYYGALSMATGQTSNKLGDIATTLANGGDAEEKLRGQVREFYDKSEEMCKIERSLRTYLCLYPVIIMMRLFKSFDAQPRLAIVTRTFNTARSDMAHFFMVFCSSYFCMTVFGVLLFGQDIYDFATLPRALLTCFRIMLGDWDWDAMCQVGRFKAFMWFFLFICVMWMILLNMLLAIVIDAYTTVSTTVSGEQTLFQQIYTMTRRFKQSWQGRRVRLNEIQHALAEEEGGAPDEILESDKPIFVESLLHTVPRLQRNQAQRTLQWSVDEYSKANDPAFSTSDMEEPFKRMISRSENALTCCAYVATKIAEYQELELRAKQAEQEREEREEQQRKAGEGDEQRVQHFASMPPNPTPAEYEREQFQQSLAEGIAAVKLIAEERTAELSTDMAMVLAEEMQSLQRRQEEQDKLMEQMQDALKGLHNLVRIFGQTCDEVGRHAADLADEVGGEGQNGSAAGDSPTHASDGVMWPAGRGGMR